MWCDEQAQYNSCDGNTSTESSPHEIHSRSPIETDDDDDSGIKVEMLEASHADVHKEKDDSKEFKLNGVHENGCSNNLSDSDHSSKEQNSSGSDYEIKSKYQLKDINHKRKSFAKTKR